MHPSLERFIYEHAGRCVVVVVQVDPNLMA
jgi:hypothetical protein